MDQMFCYQCEMSAEKGCGSKNQTLGTCGKDENLARLQDMMIFGLKGLAIKSFAPKLKAFNTISS